MTAIVIGKIIDDFILLLLIFKINNDSVYIIDYFRIYKFKIQEQ